MTALTRSIRSALDGHRARNCYEQRYDRWLLQCLDEGCRKGEGPIGGDCTLTGS